nr:ATP-binding protein [Klebsiella oxytoca]
MVSTTLKFGGKIIEELSQKIPSTLFALNELVKNSYDAFSPEVTITIVPSKLMITVSDRGNGMSLDEINSLFHISKSTKRYGYEVRQNEITRIIQGSKGLGFLSAFKFGDKVEWKTCKNGICSVFSIKKTDLVNKDDVSGINIPIKTEHCTENGTEIKIYTNQQEMDDLMSDLSDDKISSKLVSSMMDDSFDIRLVIENKDKIASTKKIKSFISECESSQLFYVEYNSFKEEINFYHKGELISQTPFTIDRIDYSIEVKIIIFLFEKGRNTRSISNLYKRVHDNALYPLVYINKNLFNNTRIFDPEVLRKRSSGSSLPQMIGKVSILSQNGNLEFNSDRTSFVENNLTKNLMFNLKKLNETIQVKGSELKNKLKANSSSSLTGKAYPIEGEKNIQNKPASISIDRKKKVKFFIPSEQINLREYIYALKDSYGNEINKENISISINGRDYTKCILETIEEPCELQVLFRYKDSITGLVSADVNLTFERKTSNITGNKEGNSLFTIQSASGYSVQIGTVSSIIYAIDRLYSLREKEGFLPLIACSIRSIFEISQDKLFRTHRFLFPTLKSQLYTLETKREMKDKLLGNIVHIILLIKKNPSLSTKIAERLDISYSTFINSLNIDEFKAAVKHSHIGAHQSTKFLSKPKIEACADSCGLFAVICDVLIHMKKSDINELRITKVTTDDLNHCFKALS